MKALPIPENAQHVLLLESGDRFVYLEGGQSAVVLDYAEGEEGDPGIKVTTHYPNLEKGEDVPLSVMLTACVKIFLENPEWVLAARQQLIEMEEEALKKQNEKQQETSEASE